jgi:zinc protease
MQINAKARAIAAALTLLGGLVAAAAAPAAALAADSPPSAPSRQAPEIVTVPSASSPLVAIRLMFRAGSIDDPPGKEGLASLTSLMVAASGTAKRSYSQILEDLYPLAASIDSNADREVTVFSGTVPRGALDTYTALLAEALVTPGFADSDFRRNKQQLLSYLTDTLRSGNDEMLGLEALQDRIFAHHPYGHSPAGTVTGLNSITLDDVRAFYRGHYTRANLMIGIAGGYPAGFGEKLATLLAPLPAAGAAAPPVPPPPAVEGRHITIIDKETDSVGVHFGFPLPITRKDDDFYPLLVANSYLGEHRTFTGILMGQLRQQRGLNYGDYSYIEYWDSPPYTSQPPPNVPRREQYFSVWLRPVVPADAQFALRAALFEVERVHERGLTQQEFELTRDFLINYSKLWVQDLSSRLGYHMDSRYYGMPYYIDEIETRLRKLTVDDVNRAARKYLGDASFDAVIVSANGNQLKELLQRDAPSPKKYNSQVSDDVLAADKTIIALPVHATGIEVVPVAQEFEK